MKELCKVDREIVVKKPRLLAPIPYCAGCHYGMVTRLLVETTEELGITGKVILVTSASCSGQGIIAFPYDGGNCPHGRAPALALGIKLTHPEAVVIMMQGDGDLAGIGLGHFMHSMNRGDCVTTIFLNNACYGQTGGQLAPTTLVGMKTTTTPDGRQVRKHGRPFHVAEMAAANWGTAYAARCSVHTPANFQRTRRAIRTAIEKQRAGAGFSIVEILSVCPTNWGLSPIESLKFLEEKMIAEFPLGEFKNVDSVFN